MAIISKNGQVWYESTLEAGKGRRGEFYRYWNLSRFLKPQSAEGVLPLSRHQEWQKKVKPAEQENFCAFHHATSSGRFGWVWLRL